MKKVYLLIFVFLFNILLIFSQIKPDLGTQINENDKRKFDFFFYEALREKMLGNKEKAIIFYNECLKINPKSSSSLYELANLYISKNEFEKAQITLESARKYNTDNYWIKSLLGEVYQQRGEYDKAILLYKELVKNRNDNSEYQYYLSQLYIQKNDFKSAIKQLNLLESKLGIIEPLSLDKQKLYVQEGKKKEALKEINNLINRYPDDLKFYIYLGDTYLIFKEFDKSIEIYNNILKRDSSYAITYFSIANVYLIKKDTIFFKKNLINGLNNNNISIDYKLQRLVPLVLDQKNINLFFSNEEWDNIFKLLITSYPEEQRTFYFYGNYLKNSNRVFEAIECLRQCVDLDISNEQYWNDLLLLELINSKYDYLIIDTKRAIEYCPENALFYLFSAYGFSQKNDGKEAIKSLNKGFSLTINNLPLKEKYCSLFGDLYYSLKEKDSSFYYYEEALKINDKNLMVLNNYSYYLSLDSLSLDKAEKMSSKCISQEPANSTYLDTYAWILFKRNRFLEAKFIIERAIDNGGSSNDVIVEHYGDILFFNNDIEGAVREWNRSLELGNSSEVLVKKISSKKYIKTSE